MALEVLTDEGVKALNTAIASGPRLVVEFAAVGDKEDLGVSETATSYAHLTAADISAWGAHEGDRSCTMDCVALLPSEVEIAGESPKQALDIEFSWLPSGEIEFDTIAVFARLYYPYSKYAPGEYHVGDIVWYGDTDPSYYMCIAECTVTDTTGGPSSDYWTGVQLTQLTINQGQALRAPAGADSLILLHVSTTGQKMKMVPGLEFNYKVRLLLDGAGYSYADASSYPVYLESLVPAGDAAMQLTFLSQMAQTMQVMREKLVERG